MNAVNETIGEVHEKTMKALKQLCKGIFLNKREREHVDDLRLQHEAENLKMQIHYMQSEIDYYLMIRPERKEVKPQSDIVLPHNFKRDGK